MTEDDIKDIPAAGPAMPPWSYSSLTAFETCPHRYYETRVLKNFHEQQTEATIWGNEVHKALELRVKESKVLPEAMQKWEPLAERLQSEMNHATVLTEYRLTLTKQLTPTKWSASDAWCRGICDVVIINGEEATSVDWKTGKRKPGSEQLRMSAAMLMVKFPEVQTVKTAYVWLKEDAIDKDVVTREDVPAVWKDFGIRVARMEESYEKDKWQKRSSGLCKNYCPVSTCEFHGGKRR